jgi:DNA repair protein RecN (Recombination protein N)
VNDSPVKLKVLQELKPYLLDIHSQNEAYLFSTNQFQYAVLDQLSKENTALLKDFNIKFKKLQQYRSKYQELEKNKIESRKRQDYIQFLHDELDGFKLREGIQEEVEQEYQSLKNADSLKLLLSESIEIIQQENIGVIEQLSVLNKKLQQLAGYLNSFDALAKRLDSVYIEMNDIVIDLERGLDAIEDDPAKLEQVEGQLQSLNSLLLKHQVSTDKELIALKQSFEEELKEISDYDTTIASTSKAINDLIAELNSLASKLTENRKVSAKTLEKLLVEGLSQLGMKDSKLQIDIEATEDFNAFGKDKVEWLFSANVGMPLRPLYKVVSGGEMSRILLVLKSILANHEQLPCIIFDEIDTGVSGEIALKMAQIMAQMSSRMQVISITHLPQIAAKGKQHLKVLKVVKEQNAETQIINLSKDRRVVELAQMLGGDEQSSSAIAHAKSLLN